MSMYLQFIFIPKSSRFIVPVGVVTSTELRAFDISMLTKKKTVFTDNIRLFQSLLQTKCNEY